MGRFLPILTAILLFFVLFCFLKCVLTSSAGLSKEPSQASCGLSVCVCMCEWVSKLTDWWCWEYLGSAACPWISEENMGDHLCVWLQGILNTAARPPMNVRSRNGGASPVRPVASWNASKWGCWKKVRQSQIQNRCLSWQQLDPGLAGCRRITTHLPSLTFLGYFFKRLLKESGSAVTKRAVQRGEWF